jgi:sodium/proline symporter
MTAVLLTLVVYNLLLIGVGVWARGRNRDVSDFFLAGRKLGPWIAAISASASSSSAWTLLGVSGVAFKWGWPALWLFPSCVGGFILNWLWVAPRLRVLAGRECAVTVSAVIAPAGLGRARRLILRIAAVIIVFCFVFYIASQFEGAAKAFESTFGLPKNPSILIGACIVLAYTLLGGFWAVSVTDTLQGLLMAAAAVVLPIAALIAVGGIDGLTSGMAEVGSVGSPTVGLPAVMAIFFVLGILGIGIGYPGQPHVVNRFMALRDERSLRQGRVIAVGWSVVVFAGMLMLGLCGRVLVDKLGDTEQVMFRMAQDLLPAVLAGVVIAAVLSAIMSTADSQLLVASSAISHDWNLTSGRRETGLGKSRVTVVIVLVLATGLALFVRKDIYSRVLFAWSALGAAFGPILLIRLLGRSIRAWATLAAMLAGFGLTVLISMLPDPSGGDVAERLVPFLVALAIAVVGSRSE